MNPNDKEYLDHLRHSAAHLLAAAVLQLYPDTKNTLGPAIENGFYYDFDFGDVNLQESDLQKIEDKMREILPSWIEFTHKQLSAQEAKDFFKDNPYKLELIEEIEGRGEKITLYTCGEFVDLCRGGHVENPSEELGAIKLLNTAGAYWRGSEKNKMLTRIYGTAFREQAELNKHLELLEEAKKRDHRKLGMELELFTINQEEIGPGLILWLPKGTILKDELEKLGKEKELQDGYQRVSTPHIAKETLFKLSGHLPYYEEDMYPPMDMEGTKYYLKPMNCPHMHMLYKAKKHTYKELPIRYAEFGTVYRNEDSGTLFGLMRVRGLTQNDAHIYCTKEQAVEELVKVMELHSYYYQIFGIKDFYIELALPDFEKKKDKYFDNPQAWEESIAILKEAAKALNVEVVEDIGGAAFYGPKFDFNIKSATGRTFGASTNQLDFGSGKRFGLTYIDSDGVEKDVPYIIHRAPLGSDERFIGFLIEHFGGAFPTWLSPTQVTIIPISERNNSYAQKVLEQLRSSNIRAEVDERGETMQAKIRDAQLQKIPYMLIVGDREESDKKVSVRARDKSDLGVIEVGEFLAKIKEEIALRQTQGEQK